MMTNAILKTACRLIVALALVFAAFLFFKGHQTPGGGFVGGLVAAMGLIIHRMAEGPESLKRIMMIKQRTLIALGLSCAFLAGIGAVSLGLPFLASNFGYLPLPGTPPVEFEWATVMLFDLGVLLVVVGVVVGMIDGLSKELD